MTNACDQPAFGDMDTYMAITDQHYYGYGLIINGLRRVGSTSTLKMDILSLSGSDIGRHEGNVLDAGQKRRGDKSCGIFPRHSLIRRVAMVIAHSGHFSRVMLVVIALNAAFLAMWDPVANLYQLPSVRNNIVRSSELFFQTSYSVEMVLIMVADGLFWESKQAYFRSAWHWFDFTVVLLGWIALGFEYTSSTGASPLLRVIRVLRPLRGLQYVPGLTVLNNTIVRSLEQLGDVLLFLLFTYFVLSVVGLTVFEGRLHQRCGWQSSIDGQWYLYPPLADRFCSLSAIGGLRCPDVNFTEPGTGLERPVVCAPEFDAPNTGLTGFDNIFQSMITVFVMVTMEGWTGVMVRLNIWGEDTN